MKVKRFPRLFLVFTALMVTVCRCSFDRGTPVIISFDDGTNMKCVQFIDYLPNWSSIGNSSSTYDCSLPCPDGSIVPFSEVSSPELIQAAAEDGKVPASVLQSLQKEYCSAASLIKATATATVTSTSVPTKTATPATVSPVITGEVTACDVRAKYINLRLSQPQIDFSANIVTIKINGVSSECVIPSVNSTVLSCTLPQPQTFPINIEILVNGRPASNFSFDNSVCGFKDPSAPDDNQPRPTPGPNDPQVP